MDAGKEAVGTHTWVVAPAQEGARLDLVVSAKFQGWSRSRVQRLIRDGAVLVGEAVVTKPGHTLVGGETLQLLRTGLAESERSGPAPAEVQVLYSDEHIVVVDKPPGIVAHPAEGRTTGRNRTVSEQVNAQFGPMPEVQGADRPGIVHRLDRDTSGVMVLGRTLTALEELKRQFAAREVEKTYLTMVQGDPRFDSDWIEGSIGRSKRHPDRMSVLDDGEGRKATTYYEVRERFGTFALLACFPKTGRTHQIRLHLASVGHPVLFDTVYRTRGAVKSPYPAEGPRMGRQALHAQILEFTHPASGERVRYEAEVPADFQRTLEFLRSL